MLLYITLNSIIEVLAVIVPVLLTVAFVTILERKSMASMQRRLGPNIVGVYGSLQAFADALKLLLKEYISPTQANLILFFLGPIITLVFSLLGFAVIPFGPGLAIIDFSLAILYVLAVSSLSTYGILLAGWSANSKYAFLGSLRSTAQLISYELILSSAILLVVLLTGSLSLTVNIEAQRAVWYILPLVSMFIVFLIGAIAETNRAPFDLAEAESELVSGFMTEHAAVIFVFFFLAEYGSIVLICTILATLFIGGYLLDITSITYLINSCINCLIDYLYIIITIIEIDFDYILDPYHHPFSINPYINSLNSYHIFHQHSAYDEYKPLIPDTGYQSNVFDYLLQGIFYGFLLGLKVFFMIFVFIWGRASFPRIRFDQLMSLCWTILLPIVIGFIILLPCIISSSETIASNFCLLLLPFLSFKASPHLFGKDDKNYDPRYDVNAPYNSDESPIDSDDSYEDAVKKTRQAVKHKNHLANYTVKVVNRIEVMNKSDREGEVPNEEGLKVLEEPFLPAWRHTVKTGYVNQDARFIENLKLDNEDCLTFGQKQTVLALREEERLKNLALNHPRASEYNNSQNPSPEKSDDGPHRVSSGDSANVSASQSENTTNSDTSSPVSAHTEQHGDGANASNLNPNNQLPGEWLDEHLEETGGDAGPSDDFGGVD